MHVRADTAADHEKVARIVEAAFGQPGESRLVDSLRLRPPPRLLLVAEEGDSPLGHACFSPVTLEQAGAPPMGALAPIAVLPARQNRGIGSALVRAGFDSARAGSAGGVRVWRPCLLCAIRLRAGRATRIRVWPPRGGSGLPDDGADPRGVDWPVGPGRS